MAEKVRLLDLLCGAGGAAKGYHDAGFEEIVGVDITPQPHYPYEFILADAMEYPLEGFDLIHASPPCQHYTQMLNHGLTDRNTHPDLIASTRTKLMEATTPWVIENVVGAPLLNPVTLCGESFNLRVTRHRLFEASFPLVSLKHSPHKGTGIRKQGDGGYYYRVYGHETGKREWGAAMGIDWMTKQELTQAIPPAYTEYIGLQLLRYLDTIKV